MKLVPTNGRILVKKANTERLEGKIYVPDSKSENRVEIVCVSDTEKDMGYSVGNIVYIDRLSNKTPVMGLYAIHANDIICMEKENDPQDDTP